MESSVAQETTAPSVYDDPVYAKFKNVLKGAEHVSEYSQA